MGLNSTEMGNMPFHLQPLNKAIRGFNPKGARAEDIRQRELQDMYERALGGICVNRHKWTGLEQTRIDKRYLEMRLYLDGLAVVVRDDGSKIRLHNRPGRVGTNKIVCLAATPGSTKNLNDNPVSFTTYGPYYNGGFVQARDCVPVWTNSFRVPDTTIVKLFAFSLARIDRTIEINTDNTRRPKFVAVSENAQYSAANIQNQIEQGMSVIGVSPETFDEIKMETIDLGVDVRSIEALSIERTRLWSRAMGLLGVNNANQDKKERLVESEVSANDDQVDAIRRDNLAARELAAELMRERYADMADVKVVYNDGIEKEAEEPSLDLTLGQ